MGYRVRMLRPSTLCALATLLGITTSLSAQASFTNYGSGCGSPGSPPPLIRFSGLPQIGTSYTVQQIALPNGISPVSVDLPILISGLQRVSLPVPTYSPTQPTNCMQLTSIDVFEIMPQTSASRFATSTPWVVPNNPNLIGLQYHHQWASLYSRCAGGVCTPQLVRVSDAAIVTVGI